jgi:sulfate adenylyltransferase
MSQASLISPYGGTLVNLLVAQKKYEERKSYASNLHSIQLSEREICDLELLAVGGFSPLQGFMGEADHNSVVNNMRLADGTLWPMPIVLTVDDKSGVEVGMRIALRNRKNRILAIMEVEEKYVWNCDEVSQKVFGTWENGNIGTSEQELCLSKV